MRTDNQTTLQLTASREERTEIEAAAKAAGLSLSNHLRKCLGLPVLVRTLTPEAASRAGRLGGIARTAALTPKQRSRIAALGGKAKGKRGKARD